MNLLYHIYLSSLVAAIIFLVVGLWGSVLAFFVGALMDIDHIFDFLLWNNERSIRSFLVMGTWFTSPHRTDTFLHSYELLVLSFLVFVFLGQSSLGIGLSFGMAGHLVSDQIFNNLRYGTYPLSYSILYRLLKHSERLVRYKKRLAIYDAVLKRDGYKCRICGSARATEIHMEGFAWGEESPEHYIAVCKACHTQRHDYVLTRILKRGQRQD